MRTESPRLDVRLAGIATWAELEAGRRSSRQVGGLAERGELVRISRSYYAKADLAELIPRLRAGRLLSAAAVTAAPRPGVITVDDALAG